MFRGAVEGLRDSQVAQTVGRINARFSLIKPEPDESIQEILHGGKRAAKRAADVYINDGEDVRLIPGAFYRDKLGRPGRYFSSPKTYTVVTRRQLSPAPLRS